MSDVVFPKEANLRLKMFNPRMLTNEQIITAQNLFFSTHEPFKDLWVDWYTYSNPDGPSLDKKEDQIRPIGPYAFSCGNTQEPDQDHRNKSYTKAVMEEKIPCLNRTEYLLVFGYYFYKNKIKMDKIGWTILASRWFGGYAVVGGSDGKQSCLDFASPSYCSLNAGARKLVLHP